MRYAWGVWPPVRPAAARQLSKSTLQLKRCKNRFKAPTAAGANAFCGMGKHLAAILRYAWGVWPPDRPAAARQPFGAEMYHFGRPGAGYLMFLLGTSRNGPFGAKSWPEACWSLNLPFWTARGRLFKFFCGNEPKRLFWAKSWPGDFWSSNLPFWTARGRLLNFFSGNEPKRSF